MRHTNEAPTSKRLTLV